MSISTSSLIDDVNRSMRENPAAAGLIGLGIAWMLFGRSNMMAIGSYAPRVAGRAARTASAAAGAAANSVASGVDYATRSVSDGMEYATRAVNEGMDSAASGISDAASSIKDSVSRATGSDEDYTSSVNTEYQRSIRSAASGAGHSMVSALQQNLSDALDRQPILLGTIGLALGAGIACALPSTSVERRLMAEKSAALKDTMGDMMGEAVEEAADRVEHVTKTVMDEANHQVEAVKSDLSQTAEKLAAVASTAKSSTKRRRKEA